MCTSGALFRSISGRDKKRVFIALGCNCIGSECRVILSDGLLHPLAKTKSKNLRHVEFVGRISADEYAELQETMSDETIHDIIVRYDEHTKQKIVRE